jgi:hypothetical protein
MAALGKESEGFRLAGLGIVVISIGLWSAVRRSEKRPPILQVASPQQALAIALAGCSFAAFFISVALLIPLGPEESPAAQSAAAAIGAVAALWVAWRAFRRLRSTRNARPRRE